MTKHGKKYLEKKMLIDPEKVYSPEEAIDLLKQTAYARFDETVELHVRTGVDPRQADQQVRGVVQLPAGRGKKIRVLVFAEGEAEKVARDAGADYVGSDELIKQISEGWLEFDVAIATPQMMGKVGRLGKILGRRGLMPNPKAGTIADISDLPRIIAESRGGRVEFKIDKTANVHIPIGKISFTKEQLLENLAAAMDAIVRAKPTGAKGQYIKRITLATTMGPGIRLDLSEAMALKPAA